MAVTKHVIENMKENVKEIDHVINNPFCSLLLSLLLHPLNMGSVSIVTHPSCIKGACCLIGQNHRVIGTLLNMKPYRYPSLM